MNCTPPSPKPEERQQPERRQSWMNSGINVGRSSPGESLAGNYVGGSEPPTRDRQWKPPWGDYWRGNRCRSTKAELTPRRHNEHRETKEIQTESNDKDAAERLAVSLSSRDYPCYLDTFDPNVDGDSPELESYLRRVIDLCNNLMAMVSRTTRMSWWVPLEIGVALEKEKHIATYLLTAEDLPIYLWQWPMLRSDRDAL